MENWKKLVHGEKGVDTKTTKEFPEFAPGDNIDVHYRILEGDKERIQVFSGIVIALNSSAFTKTFIVRKISSGGVGVERVFPYYSPFISDIKVKRLGKVRRAKLYYLRDRRGKAARVKERIVTKPTDKISVNKES